MGVPARERVVNVFRILVVDSFAGEKRCNIFLVGFAGSLPPLNIIDDKVRKDGVERR